MSAPGKHPPAFLAEVKARVGLAGLVGGYVQLRRDGREWIGLCPFHAERSPSFTVNEGKGFYHCFGCGAHGDAIGFVMAIDGLSFVDAEIGRAHVCTPVTNAHLVRRLLL